MLSRIATLPFRAARRIARMVLGERSKPAPYTPPPRAWSEARHDDDHDHGHEYAHEHEHEHTHEPREVHVRAFEASRLRLHDR